MARNRAVFSTIGVALLAAVVATGVTLGVLALDSRTNSPSVDLRPGATISEDSAIVQAAAKVRPAVVSVVTAQEPQLQSGSGYLVTSDGYIVTNVNVIAGAGSITVIVPGDAKLHQARLVDYDCDTAVAVLKIDQVSGLPTLAFGDPTQVQSGQPVVAVAGPLQGGSVTRGIISALHRDATIPNPAAPERNIDISDTIQTDANIDTGTAGGPLVNIQAQVIGVAMQGAQGTGGYGLNAADIQDDVQQILQTGQVTVPSIGAETTDLSVEMSALRNLPPGSLVDSLTAGGPASGAALQPGDVITQLDEVRIDAAHPLPLLLRSQFHVGQRITVTYIRAGQSSQVQLTLNGEHPAC